MYWQVSAARKCLLFILDRPEYSNTNTQSVLKFCS
jgi:hypothetical protein